MIFENPDEALARLIRHRKRRGSWDVAEIPVLMDPPEFMEPEAAKAARAGRPIVQVFPGYWDQAAFDEIFWND